MKGLRELEILDLEGNEITRVGCTLWTLEGLLSISLADKVPELLIEIERLSQLRKLDVSGNCIKRLPEELGRFEYLELLDDSSNGLSAFPHSSTAARRSLTSTFRRMSL